MDKTGVVYFVVMYAQISTAEYCTYDSVKNHLVFTFPRTQLDVYFIYLITLIKGQYTQITRTRSHSHLVVSHRADPHLGERS